MIKDTDNAFLKKRGWRYRELNKGPNAHDPDWIDFNVAFEDPLTGYSWNEQNALAIEHARIRRKTKKKSLIIRLIQTVKKLIKYAERKKVNSYLNKCLKTGLKR